VIACGVMDGAIVILLGGLIAFAYITKDIRDDKTPDANGVITTWSIGANFLAAGPFFPTQPLCSPT